MFYARFQRRQRGREVTTGTPFTHGVSLQRAFCENTASGTALFVPHTGVPCQVGAVFATTDPIGCHCALRLHLLVLGAEVAAVETLGQVVPQLGEVVPSAGRAHGGRGGGAVVGYVGPGGTLVTDEDVPGEGVLILKGGTGFHTREQEQHW